jgi:hypothetical protein
MLQPEMREPTGEFREQPPPAVHASRTAGSIQAAIRPVVGLARRPLARGLAFAAAVGLFLSFVGAFGSARIPFATRTAWFLGFSLFGGLAAIGITRWAAQSAWAGGRRWLRFLVVAGSMTPLMGASVWLVVGAAQGRPTLGDLPGYLLISSVTSLALTGLAFAIFRAPAVTHAAPAGAAPPRFIERLPIGLKGGEIWAVEAEDHYLRIHTSRGSDLILMRLADAVAELEGIEGAQTHRSWWVARAAVKEVKRSDGRATLILPSDAEAPVSRTYARALREAGWF